MTVSTAEDSLMQKAPLCQSLGCTCSMGNIPTCWQESESNLDASLTVCIKAESIGYLGLTVCLFMQHLPVGCSFLKSLCSLMTCCKLLWFVEVFNIGNSSCAACLLLVTCGTVFLPLLSLVHQDFLLNPQVTSRKLFENFLPSMQG